MAVEMVVDLTNYKDRVGAKVPEGTYKVVVEDVEPDKSKAGNPMVNLFLRISDGGPHDGLTLVDRLTFTEKALFRVVGFMQAIGLPTPRKKLKVDVEKWRGKVLIVDVADGEPYNGKVKSEVKGYMRVGGAASESDAPAADLDVNDGTEEPSALAAEPEETEETGTEETVLDGAPETVDLDSIDLD